MGKHRRLLHGWVEDNYSTQIWCAGNKITGSFVVSCSGAAGWAFQMSEEENYSDISKLFVLAA